MPEQTTIDVPALYQGVSKQPAPLRLPGQVEASSNATYSVVDGLSKRAGSRYVKKVTGLTASGNYRLHTIERDSTEKYALIYGKVGSNMTLQIFHADGTAATVNLGSGVQTYLNATSDATSPTADDLSIVTVADYTIIVNRRVNTGSSNMTAGTVVQEYRDADVMMSYAPTQQSYYRTIEDTDAYPAGHWYYYSHDAQGPPGSINYANIVCTAQTTVASTTHTGDFDDAANNPGGFKVGFRRVNLSATNITWTAATRTITNAGAFSLYTLGTDYGGDYLRITGGTGMTPGFYKIATRVDANSITLEAAAGLSGADNADTDYDGIGREFEVLVDLTKHSIADMYDVALAFQKSLQDAGATDALINWTKTTTGGYFTIVSLWGGTGATCYATSAPSSGYDWSSGTRQFSDATINAGSGSGGTYARPVAQRWTRVAQPGQAKAKLDATTMPVQLVRTTYSAGGSTFDASAITWDDRLTGDEITNPLPTAIANTKTINDVVFWQNRLWFLSDETIFSSQVGDFFNFFINDADNITDSDPVDVTISADQVVIGEFVVPFKQALLIFTKAGRQFEAAVANNGPVTPTSLGVTPSTNYRTLVVRPKPVGNTVHFLGVGDVSAELREYYYDDTVAQSDAADVSAHVKGLLPASVRSLASFGNQGISIVLGVDGYTAYLYREFYNGSRKDQSAWTTLTFASGYRICDIANVNNQCWMLVESASQYVLERFAIDPESADSGFSYVAHMDRLMSIIGTHSAGTTTWTLPNSLSDTTIDTIILGTGTPTGTAGDILTPTTAPGTTVTKTGNYGTVAALLGRSFSMSVELSKPFRRDFQGTVKIDERLELRHIKTTHVNTGAYNLRASIPAPPTRSDKTKTFAPPTGTLVQTFGTYGAWFNGDASRLRIFIESSSPKPVTITALAYLADAIPRMG